MLKKLYLYGMRASGRILTALVCIAPAVGLIACGLLFLMQALSETTVLLATLSLIYGLLLFGMFISVLVCAFFIIYRYYKNFFTDEGYLTLVIPATMEEQVGAKILSAVSWSFIAGLSLACGMFFAVGIPAIVGSIQSGTDSNFLLELLHYGFAEMGGANFVLFLLSALLTLIAQIIIFYTAITLGSLLMRKNKIIGSILFYLVVNFAVTTLRSLFSVITELALHSVSSSQTSETISYIIAIVLNLIISFSGYFLITHLMNRKMNLE